MIEALHPQEVLHALLTMDRFRLPHGRIRNPSLADMICSAAQAERQRKILSEAGFLHGPWAVDLSEFESPEYRIYIETFLAWEKESRRFLGSIGEEIHQQLWRERHFA